MSIVSGIVVYLLLWWVTLFATLPLGVRGQAEENNVVPGTEPGAPVKADMKRKLILTTIIASILWVIICSIIVFGWIDWTGNPYGDV